MIPAGRAHLNVAATSHSGMSGKNNEDRYGVSAYFVDTEMAIPALLAVVADGIGGHKAGEVAAEIAVETISKTIAKTDASQPIQALREAIVQASRLIYEASDDIEERKGMGATCACALVIDRRLYTASVGDSRIYLIREATIRQLTTDHTWVQEAIDHGVLTPDQARNHPNAHVIRRYLGSQQEVIPDFRLRLHRNDDDARAEANQGTRLQPGDMLLLCSDGLTDLVDDGEILDSLQGQDSEEALNSLIELANERGGHDNITIVALTVPLTHQPVLEAGASRLRRWTVLTCASILALGLLALGIYGSATLLRKGETGLSPTAPLVTAPAGDPSSMPGQAIPSGASTSPVLASPAAIQATPGGPATTPAATLTPWPTNTLSPD